MKTIAIKINSQFILKSLLIIGILTSLFSCEDFLEADDPFGQIPYQEVYEDEATATAALTTLYAKLRDEVLITGGTSGLNVHMGLYADELDLYGSSWPTYNELYQHQIIASNHTVQTNWNSTYNLIFMANAVLEGLEGSSVLNEGIKNQLRGEALFIRALAHFYLANLHGDLPYIRTTDYRVNKDVSRLALNLVYEQLLTDLNEAKSLLSATYVTGERTRANSFTASALLARVYLYMGRWQEAEAESSIVINHSGLYSLEPLVENEFLINSSSAILQLKPKNEGSNSQEASTFIFSSGPPPFVALSPELVDAFEENDLRKTHWVGEISDGSQSWYYPHKYKENLNTGTSLEYSMVFRLAEQYLIRAEARANQNNTSGAQQDINILRQRAGLDNTVANTQNTLLEAILNERRFELFTEYGHRWFDIKRSNVAGQILSPLKPGWKPTNILWPIPEADILINPNLAPQNPGY